MRRTPEKQTGLGLLEILISIAIGVFILSGVFHLWATSRGNSTVNLNQANIQGALRYIISQLERDASQVGVAGCFSQAFRKNELYLGSILDDAGVPATNLPRFDTRMFINGRDNSGVLASDEVLLRSSPSSLGIPVLRYRRSGAQADEIALDLSTPFAQQLYSGIQQFDILLAADCSSALFFMVTNTPANDGVLQFEANVSANTGVNQGFRNKLPAGASIARLEDEGDATNFEDNLALSDWDDNRPGFLSSTRPYVYLTSASSTAVYRLGDSQRAADLTALGQVAQCSEQTPQFCALLRNGVEVAEGVTDFQIEYGWHVAGEEQGAVRFGNAAEAASHFNNVDRIRVTLQLNAVGAGRRQEALTRSYTRTIALRNQIGT